MNYRHAFHAGNFADVMKHAVLARLHAYLARKEAAYRYIDTHAGIGLYDLAADEAQRTGEAQAGIGRLDEPFAPEVEALLAPYREALAAVRARHGESAYPGSPALAREMLRRQDRGILVELHPQDAATLTARYETAANLKVLALDGWTALTSLIPPKEKRGLVLVDPPFEAPGELDRLARALVAATGKWPTGVYAGWYPIKDPREADRAAAQFRGLARPGLRLELLVDDTKRVDRLNGCGLFVINPPFTLEDEARLLLPALAQRLGRAGKGSSRVVRIGAAP
ncbi:23S rRNA (adenine(2030)-N(6))-methyltransferase RlmJ [Salinarimonas ramus]|uniref:Ribosomal RNA large subunit methyltransferase J n=1 Tax=Salinarimonas ramus TaxID=690164 RepID=A0A917V2L6_9HYPH|nr:23S rRNA (adenine(2030)-N(6))-methyltransferase RlmJ [Salinarimonas ramus]GGK24993.1 ribosomal RNA large subunit methyltransferase J [Salinarimonas ramus]